MIKEFKPLVMGSNTSKTGAAITLTGGSGVDIFTDTTERHSSPNQQFGAQETNEDTNQSLNSTSTLSTAVLRTENPINKNIYPNLEGDHSRSYIPSDNGYSHTKNCTCSACKGNASEDDAQSSQSQVGIAQNNSSEALTAEDLVSESFGDTTKDYLNGSEVLYYYIYDEIETYDNYLGSGAALQTRDHLSDSTAFIHDIFVSLDPLIGLDFQYTDNIEESHLTIVSVYEWSGWSEDTVGQVIDLESIWHVLWKDTGDNSLNRDSTGSSDPFDANTIIHEIGHALGLSHPRKIHITQVGRQTTL